MKNIVFVSSLLLFSLSATLGFSQSDARNSVAPEVRLPPQSQSPILEWQGDGELPSYPLADAQPVQPARIDQPALPGAQADVETETLMESESQSPYVHDSLEPAAPAAPEMDFPYRQPSEQVLPQDIPQSSPQNSLKPALPVARPALPVARPTLGVTGQPVEGWGFAIQSVLPNSPAARMRLAPGDVIMSINGTRVCSPESIARQLLRSSNQQGGTGILVVDNVDFRNTVSVVRTCRGSYSRPSNMRFQRVRFQL